MRATRAPKMPHGFRPTAEQWRIAEKAIVSPDGERIEFRIQRRLLGGNAYTRLRWKQKQNERLAWQTHLINALIVAAGAREAQRILGPASNFPGSHGGCVVRRRVEVTRFAPTRSGLIRDDDNLRFAVKPLHDALTHLGLIRDDKREWIEAPSPEQELSNDKTWWTWIAISDPLEPMPAPKTRQPKENA